MIRGRTLKVRLLFDRLFCHFERGTRRNLVQHAERTMQVGDTRSIRFLTVVRNDIFFLPLDMTSEETKIEILKIIDELADDSLPYILAFLVELKKTKNDRIQIDTFLQKTFMEDKGLLQRLANS